MSTKSPFGRHRDALFGPRVLQMAPKWPKGGQRAQKGIHFGLLFRSFSLFLNLGCQMGSGMVSERPPAPKNDQNYIKNRCPDDSIVSKSDQMHTRIALKTSSPNVNKNCKTKLDENKLSNPSAKNCKEPCTPSEPPKRTKTSRCGGVASCVLNIYIYIYIYT